MRQSACLVMNPILDCRHSSLLLLDEGLKMDSDIEYIVHPVHAFVWAHCGPTKDFLWLSITFRCFITCFINLLDLGVTPGNPSGKGF